MSPGRFAFLLILVGSVFCRPSSLQAQHSYSNTPVVEIVEDLQESTPYRFLYREALLSDINISLDANRENLLDELQKTLDSYGLSMQVDEGRNQVLILKSSRHIPENRNITLSGQVVDAVTGERLPYATVSWTENDELNGTIAGSAGTFRISLETPENTIPLNTSYVGYNRHETDIGVGGSGDLEDITIRLYPQTVTGNEIVVSGSNPYAQQDSSLTGLIKRDRFSPLGEGNTIRALQILPAAGVTTAMNDGLNIRGSTRDGFQVELDGITIFNQSHLFGMLDSFNEDAIQNSGFFYDVAPAQVNAPTGGKLSLITKTGSLNKVTTATGFSNSSARATVNGPFVKGKSSWLLSGRTSYMNQLDWFNNEHLIRWGLDIDRPGSLDSEGQNINSRLVTPGNSDAYFYDLHGKAYVENNDGSRTFASLYFGGDRTTQDARRITRDLRSESRFSETTVYTNNEWKNFAASGKHQRWITPDIYSHTTVGISSYETLFSKDDFLYTRTIRTSDSRSTAAFTGSFADQSTMNQAKVDQSFDLFKEWASITAGFAGYYHRGQYLEESFDRPGFTTQTEALQADLYLQADRELFEAVDLQLGTRMHYYSHGDYLKASPRLKARFFKKAPVSAGIGYSRNYQFLHRINFSNVITPDLWILTNEQQPPSSADHYSAGLYLKPYRTLFLQIEGYLKEYSNLRLHEINTQSLTNTFSESPWFYENNGDGRGIEVLLRQRFPLFTFTQTYTLSSMKLQNERLNQGEAFYAEWDRTHRASTMLEIPVLPQLQVFASCNITSGSPAYYFDNTMANESRLGPYYRLDLSAQYAQRVKESKLEAKLSLFNVLDRQNPWYREIQLVIDNSRIIPSLRPAEAEIYDLGLQPSFEVKWSF